MAQRTKHSQGRGKKGRKIGRTKNKPSYKRYLATDKRNRNAARKLKKYMKKFPNWKPNNVPDKVLKYL